MIMMTMTTLPSDEMEVHVPRREIGASTRRTDRPREGGEARCYPTPILIVIPSILTTFSCRFWTLTTRQPALDGTQRKSCHLHEHSYTRTHAHMYTQFHCRLQITMSGKHGDKLILLYTRYLLELFLPVYMRQIDDNEWRSDLIPASPATRRQLRTTAPPHGRRPPPTCRAPRSPHAPGDRDRHRHRHPPPPRTATGKPLFTYKLQKIVCKLHHIVHKLHRGACFQNKLQRGACFWSLL